MDPELVSQEYYPDPLLWIWIIYLRERKLCTTNWTERAPVVAANNVISVT